MTDEPEFEEMEHIPWAALAAKRPDPRLRIGALTAVGLLAVVAGVLAASVLLGRESPTPLTVEPTATVPVATGSPPETTTTTLPPETLPVTSTYSEADLMLISIEDEERLAVMHAEWFVRDYFTVDGDESIGERIAELVPHDAEVPGLASSYVEWVESFAVDSLAPGDYLVEVAYRLLIGTEDGFVREPAAAVAVAVSIDVDGTAKLLQLPEAVALPAIEGMDTAAG
ncbi:MAG: hypothetical protein GY926_17500 [bacterium]|nr:hypothetical protein [bacterium]